MTTKSTLDYVADEPEKKPRQNTGNHPDPMEQQSSADSGTITALAVIEIKKGTALSVFTADKGLDPYLKELETRARAAIAGYDVTTIAGQDGIRSVAYSLSRSKKPLENLASDLKRESDALIDKVNHERDRGINFITDLQKELRRPLTEYEEKEKVRIGAHKQRLEVLAALTVFDEEPTVESVQSRINSLDDFKEVVWQEFTESAKAAREKVETTLADMLVKIKKAEDDAAELARLRKEQAEREQKERDEKIAAAAAETARKEAERIAAEEKAAIEKKAAEERAAKQKVIDDQAAALAKADQDKKDAAEAKRKSDEKAAADAKALAEKVEADKAAAKKKSEDDAAASAKALKDAEDKRVADLKAADEKAERDKAAALKKQKDDAAAAQKALDEAAAKRAADTAHKAKINNAALAAIKALPSMALVPDATIQEIIVATAKNQIPAITITY